MWLRSRGRPRASVGWWSLNCSADPVPRRWRLALFRSQLGRGPRRRHRQISRRARARKGACARSRGQAAAPRRWARTRRSHHSLSRSWPTTRRPSDSVTAKSASDLSLSMTRPSGMSRAVSRIAALRPCRPRPGDGECPSGRAQLRWSIDTTPAVARAAGCAAIDASILVPSLSSHVVGSYTPITSPQ